MVEVFLIVSAILLLLGGGMLFDWLMFKGCGHAQPDEPDQEDYPVITGSADAHAVRQVDLALKSEENSKEWCRFF